MGTNIGLFPRRFCGIVQGQILEAPDSGYLADAVSADHWTAFSAVLCGRHLQQGRHWCRERCNRSVCDSGLFQAHHDR